MLINLYKIEFVKPYKNVRNIFVKRVQSCIGFNSMPTLCVPRFLTLHESVTCLPFETVTFWTPEIKSGSPTEPSTMASKIDNNCV